MASKAAVALIETNNITGFELADKVQLGYLGAMISSFDRAGKDNAD